MAGDIGVTRIPELTPMISFGSRLVGLVFVSRRYGKDRAMKKTKHTVAGLEQRVRELEAEKGRLKSELASPSEIPHQTLS